MERWLEGIVFRLDAFGFGRPLRIGLFSLLAALPVVQAAIPPMLADREIEHHAALINGLLVGLWFLCFLAYTPLEHFKGASERRRAESETQRLSGALAEAGGSFGGSIESLAVGIRSAPDGLTEDACRYACTALLARVSEYTSALLGNRKTRLRATLAVPVMGQDGTVSSLRVWCYDRTHGDRQWTTLELDWPGAPAAYAEGDIKIIDDIRLIRGLPGNGKRKFRSVVCIPAGAGEDGKPLAIVNIDATEPEFFDAATVLATINPFVQPAVQAIGLALQSRRPDARFVFGK